MAQTIVVKDSLFAKKLCLEFPSAMSPDCLNLDTAIAKTLPQPTDKFLILDSKITNVDEILYFKSVDSIIIRNNNLVSFPLNLDGFKSIGRLNIINNGLTELPDIVFLDANGIKTGVRLFYGGDNPIEKLSTTWYQPNSWTTVVDLNRAELTDIPTFANYTEIRRLNLRNNKLSFEDLVPIQANPRWTTSTFELFPQQKFEVKIDTVVTLGQVLTVSIGSGFSGNMYSMLKDEQIKSTSGNGDFTLRINTINDLGVYSFKITNTAFPHSEHYLSSKDYTLKIEPFTENIDGDEIYVLTPNGDGEADFIRINGDGLAKIFHKSGQLIREAELPFDWYGNNQNGGRVIPGYYIIQLPNGEKLKALIGY